MSIQTLHELIIRTTWEARCATWSIQAAGVKEYKADWLKEARVVMRDSTGRFAKKSADILKKLENQTAKLNEAIASFQDINPVEGFKSELIDAGSMVLEKAIAINPKYADQLAQFMWGKSAQELREMAAARYEKLSPEFASAIREDPFSDVTGDVARIVTGDHKLTDAKLLIKDIGRVFSWVGQKYNEGLDKLRNLEGPPAIRALGKVAAMGISAGVYLAATVGPDIAIGLLMAESMPVILAGAGVGLVISMGVDKIMDAAKIENPFVRFGIQILVGVASAKAISSGVERIHGFNKVEKTAFQDFASDVVADDIAASAPPPPPPLAKTVATEPPSTKPASTEAQKPKTEVPEPPQQTATESPPPPSTATESPAEKPATTESPKPKTEAPSKPQQTKIKPPARPATLRKFPETLDDLKTVSKLGGSTGAMLVEDIQTGKRFVMKHGASPGHLKEELLADDAYRILGVKVPNSKVITGDFGEPVKLSEFIEGRSLHDIMKNDPKEFERVKKELQKGFAADALLGNWDVVGMGFDNILVAADGVVYRIDNGGALRYRAQGGSKGPSWNGAADEITSMRDPAVSMQAARIFGELSDEDLYEQITDLARYKKELLQAVPPEIGAVLSRRLDNLKDLKFKNAKLRGSLQNRNKVRARETLMEQVLKVNEPRDRSFMKGSSGDKVYTAKGEGRVFTLPDINTRISSILERLPDDVWGKNEDEVLKAIDKTLVEEWSDPETLMHDLVRDADMGLRVNGKRPYDFMNKAKAVNPDAYFPNGSSPDDYQWYNDDTVDRFYNKLTSEEREAFARYTQNSNRLNKPARYGELPKGISKERWEEEFNNLVEGIAKLPSYTPAEPVARFLSSSLDKADAARINYSKQLLEALESGEIRAGTVLSDPAFTSATALAHGARAFTDTAPAYDMKIMIAPSEKSVGRFIEPVTTTKGEFEVLYPPGMNFKVRRTYKVQQRDHGGNPFEQWVVEVEEAGGSPTKPKAVPKPQESDN